MGSNGIQKILALLDGTDDEVYVGLLLSTKLLSSLAVMNEKVAFLEEIYARLKSNNFVARLFSTLSVPNDEQNETDLRAFSLSLLAYCAYPRVISLTPSIDLSLDTIE